MTAKALHDIAKSKSLSFVSKEFAQHLDAIDPLSAMRSSFHIPQHEGRDQIYFTGNSLGLMPKVTAERMEEEFTAWRQHGVEAHFAGQRPWVNTDDFVIEGLAKIIGCEHNEVVAMNSLTTNLHLLMASFYQPTSKKFKILIESDAFPSDWYAVASQIQMRGFDPDTALIRLEPREGERIVREEDIEARLEAEKGAVALVLWPGVQYFTGQSFDLAKITAAAHKHGAMAGFDLAHAVGNVELRMHEWDCDFAVFCCYKYLNSGPGAIGGAFVHNRHAGPGVAPRQRLAGWWGHDMATRFEMRTPFTPVEGAKGFRLSNPPVVAVACVLGSLETFDKVLGGLPALRHKSRHLTAYFEELLVQEVQNKYGSDTLSFLTPRDESRRGAQLSLLFGSRVDPVAMFAEMQKRGIICDFREPGSIRAAPVPLYNSFMDVWRFVDIVKDIISSTATK